MTYEEILKQVTERFSELPVQISEKEMEDIARKVEEMFEKMSDKPLIKIFKDRRILGSTIKFYRAKDEDILLKRLPTEEARKQLSVQECKLEYENITIHLVGIWYFNQIVCLHFVLPYTAEEIKEFEEELNKLMEQLMIPKGERTDFINQFMRNSPIEHI